MIFRILIGTSQPETTAVSRVEPTRGRLDARWHMELEHARLRVLSLSFSLRPFSLPIFLPLPPSLPLRPFMQGARVRSSWSRSVLDAAARVNARYISIRCWYQIACNKRRASRGFILLLHALMWPTLARDAPCAAVCVVEYTVADNASRDTQIVIVPPLPWPQLARCGRVCCHFIAVTSDVSSIPISDSLAATYPISKT